MIQNFLYKIFALNTFLIVFQKLMYFNILYTKQNRKNITHKNATQKNNTLRNKYRTICKAGIEKKIKLRNPKFRKFQLKMNAVINFLLLNYQNLYQGALQLYNCLTFTKRNTQKYLKKQYDLSDLQVRLTLIEMA